MDINPILKEIIGGVATIIAALGTVWYREKWINRNKPTLLDTADRIKKVENILSEIQYELEAFRTQEWIVTNGDKTLTGHSIQKLSIFAEYNRVGEESLATTFQYVPAYTFSRNIIALAESKDGVVISHEYKLNDDLSRLHNSFNSKTLVFVKIIDLTGKWVGILSVAFDKPREITPAEIAFLKLKASQIGGF